MGTKIKVARLDVAPRKRVGMMPRHDIAKVDEED